MNKKQVVTSSHDWLNNQVAISWDANVQIRAEDLEQETDTSYTQIIKPWVLAKIIQHTTSESLILDVGCGCGYLSNAIYEAGRLHVRGIDISTSSIQYAHQKYPYITFLCEDICRYIPAERYDLCLAIMTLNNLPNLNKFFSATHRLLCDAGRVVLVIPHPCCWPQCHLSNQNYSYFQEKPYEYKFSTKGRTDYASPVLYFHRTLETYFCCIQNCGFQITMLQELKEINNQTTSDILGMELMRV